MTQVMLIARIPLMDRMESLGTDVFMMVLAFFKTEKHMRKLVSPLPV